tara:strand:+ start:3525 stop:4424 length:900 start_codon:yes stop_codon:yes gene_type:complete
MNELWSWQNHQVAWHSKGVKKDNQVAIVLIHGFGASKDHWRFNQKVIGSISSCYAIDLVGFGDSSKPKSELLYEKKDIDAFHYCFDKWSEQIIDFCNQIVQKPVILIGNSIGALIALNASEKIAKGCLGLVLINCAERTMDDKRLYEQSLFMRFIRPVVKTLVRQRLLSSLLFKKAANPTFIKKILKVAYPSGNNIDKELIDILFKPTQSKGAAEAFRGFINLFDDHLAPDLLKNLKIPTYLIWGEMDSWEPLNEAQKWLKNYSCVQSLDVIKGAGHCPHDEMPEKVNPILKKIIQEAM